MSRICKDRNGVSGVVIVLWWSFKHALNIFTISTH